MYLEEEARAQQLLSSPALGQYRTQELTLRGAIGRLSDVAAAEVISRLVGITHLELIKFHAEVGLTVGILSLPSLKGVEEFFVSTC